MRAILDTNVVVSALIWGGKPFDLFDVLPRRPDLDPLEIRRVIAQPVKKIVQKDGRIRLYGFSAGLGCYLRVVLLSNGETVHNAFPDQDFAP